jgi:cobalt-zinc-cadmium efflux system outer membrane protein
MQNRVQEASSRSLAILFLIIAAGGPAGCAFEPTYHSDEALGPTLSAGCSLSSEPTYVQASVVSSATSSIKPHVDVVSFQTSTADAEDTSVKDGIEVLPLPSRAHEDGTSADAATTADARPAVTLDQVISATLLADPKIRAGLESINQARADLRTSSLIPNPIFLSDGQLIPLQRWTPQQTGGPTQIDEQLSFPIDWFLFGKRAAAMVSANLGVRQAEADYADLVRRRVRDSALAFYDVLEAKALLTLAGEYSENMRRLETTTAAKPDTQKIDFNRVRLDRLKSERDLREAQTTLVTARAKLRSFMGRLDPDPTFDVSGRLDVPEHVETPSSEEAFAMGQANRPDIQSLRWRVSRARADIVVEDRKGYSLITPMAGYTRQFQTEALGVPDADSLDFTVTATLPFFDRNQGGRMKARSVAVQNSLNLEAGLVDLRAEIEQALQELRTAHKNLGAMAQGQLKLAADIRDSIIQAAAAGRVPFSDVLDGERNYHETCRLYVISRANYWRSLYKFSAAVGKQFSPDDGHPRR